LPADLLTYFTLSAADLAFIEKRRVEHNHLGFALQLGALRYLGFCPDDLTTAPLVMVTYLAGQLKVSQMVLAAYAQRAQTRTEHLQEIMRYLGFRLAETIDLEHLQSWLIERALEHDRPGPAAGSRGTPLPNLAGFFGPTADRNDQETSSRSR